MKTMKVVWSHTCIAMTTQAFSGLTFILIGKFNPDIMREKVLFQHSGQKGKDPQKMVLQVHNKPDNLIISA